MISVTANNVDINGFTIQNSGSTSSDSGIYVISSGNNISHNTITNNKNGIYLYYSSNDNTIHHNNFINNTDQVWSDSVNVGMMTMKATTGVTTQDKTWYASR